MTSRAGAAERNAVMQGSPANLTNAIDIVRSPHPAAGLPRTLRTPITHGAKYFDVVGENPDSVIFNSNFQDLLGWVGVQPIDPAEVVPGSDTSTGGSSTTTTTPGSGGVSGSTGPNEAMPPSISNGVQNGPYGPAGSTPPVGND